jgi:YHS domain-containing protein
MPPSQANQTLSVCGERLNYPPRYPCAFYRGQRVYFCKKSCLKAFEQDRDRFMAGEISHPTDEDEAPTC